MAALNKKWLLWMKNLSLLFFPFLLSETLPSPSPPFPRSIYVLNCPSSSPHVEEENVQVTSIGYRRSPRSRTWFSLSRSSRPFTAAPLSIARGSYPVTGNPILATNLVPGASYADQSLSVATASLANPISALIADIEDDARIVRLGCTDNGEHLISNLLASATNMPCWTETEVVSICDNVVTFFDDSGLKSNDGLTLEARNLRDVGVDFEFGLLRSQLVCENAQDKLFVPVIPNLVTTDMNPTIPSFVLVSPQPCPPVMPLKFLNRLLCLNPSHVT